MILKKDVRYLKKSILVYSPVLGFADYEYKVKII